MKINLSYLTFLFLLLFLSQSCKVNYSFTGASISPEIKTIDIKYFRNNASLIEPTLSQSLTDALRDKFVSQTSLTLVNSGGDLILEGAITDYLTQPIAIQSNDDAALNRLTIAVNVKFTNTFDETKDYETTFSRYVEYPSSKNLSDVQGELIEEINEMLIDDIFNKAVVNW
ncbi:MAG: hypothetical protein K8R58_06805 [Bacteroidales bacterium]|nr:hypothetical protein [Bacteroidales bacterium]